MQQSMQPTLEEFQGIFRESIRVGFNWNRFLTERWPIERVKLRTQSDLARCFTPWYIGKGAEELSYDHPHAVPMRLSDVPKAFTILNDERKADIQQKVRELCDDSVVRFTVPTYSLPEDGYFILDGNHSLSSLAISDATFEVELWNVRGPMEKECLLDLEFWLKDIKN